MVNTQVKTLENTW